MAFLRSSESDPSKVLLVLLVASGVETHLLLYRWDTQAPLRSIKPMGCSGRPLKEDRFPLMLIPSTSPYSFFVVLQTGISYYENVHSSDYKRIHCLFMGRAAGPLTWVHWAKPRRHNQYMEKRDDLVVVREDGLIQYFQIEKSSSTKFLMTNTVGDMNIHVDTAFCMLAGPPGDGGDIVIAAGDMTEGGVFEVQARGIPQKKQNIVNVAPVHDMVIGPHVHDAFIAGPTQLEVSDRLYICGGSSEDHSQISEVRLGLEAQLGWTMPYPDPFDISCIWSLQVHWQKSLLLVTSHSTNTNAVSYHLETQELGIMGSESLPGFDFHSPTLVAVGLANSHILQITKNGINVMAEGDEATIKICLHKSLDCLQADIFEQDNIVAMARKVCNGFEVGLISFNVLNDQAVDVIPAPSPVIVQEEPISLCCTSIDNNRLLIVGTITAKLRGYLVLPDLTLELAFEVQVSELCSQVENAPVASLTALAHRDSSPVLLLCGLRHGALMYLELTAGPSGKIGM